MLTSLQHSFKPIHQIAKDTEEARQFDVVYAVMLVFSCLISLLGLLLNSPAIIIGAMLISPLMGPILACGLAFTVADSKLGVKAARNVVLSIAEAITIAALATWLSPLRDLTPEILARTNPNLMDLLIAFFSGIAGTLAMSSRRAGLTILPGVAIATAVMPPLATVGYGISTAQWSVARGSFMLFFTNFTAIVLSAALVFLLVGFRPAPSHSAMPRHILSRHRVTLAVLVLIGLSIPLVRTLQTAAAQAHTRRVARRILVEAFDDGKGGKLSGLDMRFGHDDVQVEAHVQTSKYIEPRLVANIERRLADRLGYAVKLEVQQLQLAQQDDSSRRDFVGAGAVKPQPTPVSMTPMEKLSKAQQVLEEAASSLLAPAGVNNLRVRSLVRNHEGSMRVELLGRATHFVNPDALAITATELARQAGAPVQLAATFLTCDAGIAVAFTNGEQHVSRAELRKLNSWRLRLREKPRTDLGVICGSPDSETTKDRLEVLSRVLRRPVTVVLQDGLQPKDSVSVCPLQLGKSTSQPTGGNLIESRR